ncbi:hypothetical protein [Streptomyces sp. NPDC018036]|uniref:hypothetical protein n=1 Tax=Streptomyces sp. NPDC018036 TaxID=3365035 RepID=UPI0037974181
MNEQWHRRQRPHAVEPAGPGHAPQPAVLVHELVTAAGTDGDQALRCARRLAAALPPGARDVLLDALTETDPWPDDEEPQAYETGGGLSFDGPEYALPAARSPLSLLPAYREPGPQEPSAAPGDDGPGDGGPGDGGPGGGGPGGGGPGGGVWPEPRTGPPAAVIRLRFADPLALERAGACFEGAWSDPGTGTLQVPGDAGVQTLRSVLAALDAAALAPESLTVHTNELDDVFAAFTTLL